MRASDLTASIAIHAAVLSAAAWVSSRPPPQAEEVEATPIYFEVVEAASLASETEELAQEQAEEPQEQAEKPQEQETEITEEVDTVEEVATTPAKENETVEETTPPQEVAEAEPPQEVVEAEQPPDEGAAESQEEHAKVVAAPVALNRIVPRYPRSARRKGHEGSVTVEIEVGENGSVAGAKVVKSSGYAELDDAATAAVGTMKFAPATEDGVRVSGRLRMTFDFRLGEGGVR